MVNNNQNNNEEPKEKPVDPKDPEYRGWKGLYTKSPEAAAVHPKHAKYLRYYKHVAPHNITAPVTKAKGGMISKRTFIARGCGKVMNKRRKKTKIY
jgi:hypothetical protein